MKIKKKLKVVTKLDTTAQFVDKWGVQYRRMGLHLEEFSSGSWHTISWFSDRNPKKIWRIK